MKQQPPCYHPRAGHVVTLLGGQERYEVVSVDLPLVVLRNRRGREFKAGWRALELVERAA